MNATDRLNLIHRCAIGKLGECPDLPCRIDEMTERELAIYHVATVYGGALLAIRDWSDMSYPVTEAGQAEGESE